MHCSKKVVPVKHRRKIQREKAEPGVNWVQERRRRRRWRREAGAGPHCRNTGWHLICFWGALPWTPKRFGGVKPPPQKMGH